MKLTGEVETHTSWKWTTKPCCSNMERAMGNRSPFGLFWEQENGDFVLLDPRFENGGAFAPVKFCPWCGEKIESLK
jgi:hypothetical protein